MRIVVIALENASNPSRVRFGRSTDIKSVFFAYLCYQNGENRMFSSIFFTLFHIIYVDCNEILLPKSKFCTIW